MNGLHIYMQGRTSRASTPVTNRYKSIVAVTETTETAETPETMHCTHRLYCILTTSEHSSAMRSRWVISTTVLPVT